MTAGNDCKFYAKELLANLRRLHGFCIAFEPKTASPLDPMSGLHTQIKTISGSVISLLGRLYPHVPNDLAAMQSLFMDLEVLNLYNNILLGSIKLICATETPFFRFGPNLEFVNCIAKVYCTLVNYQRISGGKPTQLSSMLHSFEYQFGQNYITADNNIVRLDNIHDLSSHTFDLVTPPIINLEDVVKRDYFRLSMNKFSVQRQLIEIFHFASGEVAMFKVISGELPSSKTSPGHLLTQLSQGNYSLLNLGRALLFPLLREYDLEVVTDASTGVELKTATGNNVHLKLHCVDAVQWEKHWKLCIKKLFDRNDVIPLTPRSCTSASLAKSSHLFQNFKMKHNKLEDLRSSENPGLSIGLPNQVTKEEATDELTSTPNASQSGLRRSKPLQGPLSVLMCMNEEENKTQISMDQTALSDCKHPSFDDLDSFNCEKLLEIDRGIRMEMSPISMDSPALRQFKSVSQHSSMDKIGPVSEQSIETSDLESIVSLKDKDESESRDDASVFNPSADFYKPTLYRRKSSSLLSLFSSKNKKGLVVDTEGANLAASTTSLSKTNTPSSARSNLPVYSAENSFAALPSTIDLDNDLEIFESQKVRNSFWHGQRWMKFGSDSSNISILRSLKNETVLVAYEDKFDSQCLFAAHISPHWKCTKAAAQDVQVVVPLSDFLCSILPPVNITLNIRCGRSEGLFNTLQHCVKGNLPAFIPSSRTAHTLSSFPSSSASNGITRSSTGTSDLNNFKNRAESINSFLLLPSVKVKIHELVGQKGWQVQRIGHADIFSQEYKGTPVAVRFDVFSDPESKENGTTFISGLNDIRRIGRTGLSITAKEEERLLEFVNTIVADQVYKLIKPIC